MSSTSDKTESLTNSWLDESSNRRTELLKIALRNLEVGRQNLHDTQFSADAKLAHFYQGVALSIQEEIDKDVSKLIEEHFAEASDLTKASANTDNADDKAAYLVVGLHAGYNLAVVYHRRAVTLQLGEHMDVNELARARNQYESVAKTCAKHREEMSAATGFADQIQGVELAARFGQLMIEQEFIKLKRPYDDKLSVEAVRKSVFDRVQSLRQDLTRKLQDVRRECADSAQRQASIGILAQIDEQAQVLEDLTAPPARPTRCDSSSDEVIR